MKYKRMIKNPLQGERINTMATVAIVSGVAIGAVIGALFATEKGKNVRNYLSYQIDRLFNNADPKLVKKKLGNLIHDVRGHIKQSANGLLGPESLRNDVAAISVTGIPTNAWKNPREKSAYPKTLDPSIKNV